MDLEDGVQFPLRITVTLAQLVERLTFNQVVMGSIPICDKTLYWVLARGECVGVTLSNYSPVATELNDYMKLDISVFGMPLV